MSFERNALLPAALSLLASLALLTACGGDGAPDRAGGAGDTAGSADSTGAGIPASAALERLGEDVWAYQLANSTYLRLQEGVRIEDFEDYTLEEYRDRLAKRAEWRRRLADIDYAALDESEKISYDIIAFESADVGANDDDFWLTFPLTAYVGVYQFQFLKHALAAQPIENEADAAHYLHLVDEYADILDNFLIGLRGQVERGIYMPKPALPLVRSLWRDLGKSAQETVVVAGERLAALDPDVRETFEADLEVLLDERVLPGFSSLLAALDADYEAAAPAEVGLSQYPGGDAVYRRRIREYTTLALSPEEIHRRGLAAVEEAAAKMQAIRDELGFTGTAGEFMQSMLSDERYLVDSPEQLEAVFNGHLERIEPVIPGYFRTMPEAPYDVRRLSRAAEAGMAAGYYAPPTPDTPVGIYYYNGSNLDDYSTTAAATLIYHELIPGHHFHLALQAENDALPVFRKKYFASAFGEGWANYAAGLCEEMGVYEDPYLLYGHYATTMFTAMRLVVDTGMNALGWSLDEARAFAEKHTNQSGGKLEAELLRYSTSIPAQALSYRTGSDSIWALRRKAENALGEAFDIRDFHDVVLVHGTVPLGVLEKQVDAYIASADRD